MEKVLRRKKKCKHASKLTTMSELEFCIYKKRYFKVCYYLYAFRTFIYHLRLCCMHILSHININVCQFALLNQRPSWLSLGFIKLIDSKWKMQLWNHIVDMDMSINKAHMAVFYSHVHIWQYEISSVKPYDMNRKKKKE